MSQRSAAARVFLPALMVATSALCLAGATVWVRAERKPPPRFPLSLFAQARAEDFLDDEVCAGCHPAIAAEFPRTYHAAHVKDPKLPVDLRGCQACHGPGQNHVANVADTTKIGEHIVRYGKIKPAEASAACMRCHGSVMHSARWARTTHARNGVGCVDCHTVHHVKGSSLVADEKPASGDLRGSLSPTGVSTVRPLPHLKAEEPILCAKCHQREVNEFRHNFHHPVPEGRMTCRDCHELHPSGKKPAVASPNPSKSFCVRCHLEKAGPFKYEHDPVTGWTGEGCTECHRPHGSHNPGLLRSFSRGLCAQCHSEKMATHNPGLTCWNAGCHVALHGSNNDRYLLAR